MSYDNYSHKKRVTKNDKKEKGTIYSSKHIRLTLKRLEQQLINGHESQGSIGEGVCTTEVRRVVKPAKNHAHRK